MDDYKQEAMKELARRELEGREPEKQPGFLERNANYAEENINKPIQDFGRHARNFAGGFGQSLANIPGGIADLGISGINALGGNLPKVPMIDVIPKDINTEAGGIASFLAGPGALNALRKIPGIYRTGASAMKIPMIAEAIKHASHALGKSPVASRVAGNALLGGAYSPDNPLVGMGLGAAGGAAGEAISKGYGGIKNSLGNNELIKKTLEKFNPAAHGKELEHQLSQGSNSVTENSRQLSKDIRHAHRGREQESQAYYNHALTEAGHEPIYGVGHKGIITSNVPKLARMEDTFSKVQGLNAGDVFNNFKKDPTFSNAHRLQSELGSMERRIKNNPVPTQEDNLQLGKIQAAKHQVKDDISSFLEKHDQTSNMPVGPNYRKGSELFEEHVVPYLSNNKLLDMTKEGHTVVKNIHSIFDTPTNKVTKDGVEKIGAINKIMHDLPESSKERILFSAIGGNKLTPEALFKKLEEIKSKGYESYFTPELTESINALGKKLENKANLKKATGIGMGVGSAVGLYTGGHAAVNTLKNLF